MRFVYENGTIIINASFFGSKKLCKIILNYHYYSIFSLSSIIQNPIQALNNQELFLSLNQTSLAICKQGRALFLALSILSCSYICKKDSLLSCDQNQHRIRLLGFSFITLSHNLFHTIMKEYDFLILYHFPFSSFSSQSQLLIQL